MEGKEGVVKTEAEAAVKTKLVRDGYEGLFPTRVANREEFLTLLDEKLFEEAGEWMSGRKKPDGEYDPNDRDPMELADVLEVIETILSSKGRGVKYSTTSLRKITESIKGFKKTVSGLLKDRDTFDGTFVAWIKDWEDNHNFKDLAKVYELTLAAGVISSPPASQMVLENLRLDKKKKLGGFSKGLISGPDLEQTKEAPVPLQTAGGWRRFFRK